MQIFNDAQGQLNQQSELKNKPKLVNKKVCLPSANGTKLRYDGSVTMQVFIGETDMSLCDQRFE